jgi:alpha-methylacyl-CoA racemase
MPGPLAGIRVVEFAAIGPVPFAGMVLADFGADVVRIDRLESVDVGLPMELAPAFNVMARGRRSLAIDLKSPAARDALMRLVGRADVLIEGFRPGVMERLGLGPEACLATNPRLVYGRATGWGQHGPLASRAGHDLNYIALTGALHAIGARKSPPVPPLTLVGDFGGGGMVLAFGVLAALLESQRSGHGQVFDAAMADGTAYLMAAYYGLAKAGLWHEQRESNTLDGAAPWYACYRTKDDRFVAVAAIEARFYAKLLDKLGLAGTPLPDPHDQSRWPELKARLAERFATRTREEWETVFAESDACVTPVLSIAEAPLHPQNVTRGTFQIREGVPHPVPQPRFARTPGTVSGPPAAPGEHSREVLADLGFSDHEIDALAEQDAVRCRPV